MTHHAPGFDARNYVLSSRIFGVLFSVRVGSDTGQQERPLEEPFAPFFPGQGSKYDGQSEIADSDGEIVAELDDQEAVIVGEVTMDPARKIRTLGEEKRSRRRRTKALMISSRDEF